MEDTSTYHSSFLYSLRMIEGLTETLDLSSLSTNLEDKQFSHRLYDHMITSSGALPLSLWLENLNEWLAAFWVTRKKMS